MGETLALFPLPVRDVPQAQNTLREHCIKAHAFPDCGDGKRSWVPVQYDLWSLVAVPTNL
jgi:hypothetical protein